MEARTRLLSEARAWLAADPDPATRAELSALIDAEDLDALRERFSGPLQFGTAGLRGVVGAGPSRMNLVTVARAAAGFARQLRADWPDEVPRGVVVGRDGRRMSPELARVTAEVLAAHGVPVHWVPDPSPTPVVAFAHRHLDAVGTCIVTASHNPPQYNGFKVYAPNGAQIVPPQDGRIRAEADTVAASPYADIPRVDFDEAVAAGTIMVVGPELGDAYLDALDAQCHGRAVAPVRVVTTALHGVGQRWITAALARRGFEDVHPVAAQAEPDGAFPTVDFPNPEEDGALDLALALAREVDADLLLANDPDTDRLCVAVSTGGGGYQVLTGNHLGLLLADWVLRNTTEPEPLVATTVVSSMMLARIAEAHGAAYAEVLTGFKWLWNRALDLQAAGRPVAFVFGFEEALGYCVGPVVRDKDGVGAAQAIVEAASALAAEGRTLLDRLDDLERAHGVHVSTQVSVMLPGLAGKARIAEVIEGLRQQSPAEIAGVAVARSRDLAGPDADAIGLPRSNVLTFWLADDRGRIVIRPSGTEPKLKCYLETRVAADEGETLEQARARANAHIETLAAWARDVVA